MAYHLYIVGLDASNLHCQTDYKKSQVRKGKEKESVEKLKKIIQAAFKNEMGLNVDKPKAGSGTSNDGNTARNFFVKYHQSAKITGIDQDIIYRFYIYCKVYQVGMKYDN